MTTASSHSISFEFFPPRTESGDQKLQLVRDKLAARSPHFFSVTFGAGGSTRDKTFNTVASVRQSGIDTAPHLSCVLSDRSAVRDMLHLYREEGVERIVALRGDMPSGSMGGGEFRYASDLISFIREETGDHFKLSVAAYPECHPQAEHLERDIGHFVDKVKAGADMAITQYFFNADAYFHFVDRVRAHGVDIPIVPGIMPITNYSKLARFSEMCGADIPRWMRRQLASYGDDSASLQAFGHEVVTGLCQQLIDGGAPGLHFYTLNQAEPSLNIIDELRLES
ncbi:methylenetetrahydrofolate reductase [NAD(P)H] [Larsenimonas rhizosphaerae]|uniref:Methylenetetrahydrofolate reductase n=1 Tax=Larsenimonas rhizosphaerae TaxID=2944682 RepID=A0AA41ZFM2_9GAMM|nr:methylenetetrahydrofolate reductase [NAD(P)H] [Larsenimonas rhizosphaerae]MCM2129250.1 methylenetetrahydrofolate reductase [NAD(P)H] [Larsenimonas rhizosphaerae]MCX2523902.1 methylenetetrahydrofolate reductase [NAD(P)H] [Larsenimonas rhizosphaerae]